MVMSRTTGTINLSTSGSSSGITLNGTGLFQRDELYLSELAGQAVISALQGQSIVVEQQRFQRVGPVARLRLPEQ